MRVVSDEGTVTVIRMRECKEHSHTLKEADRYKRPSQLRSTGLEEVSKGYRVVEAQGK